DEMVLRLVGDHLGSLACTDLKARIAAGTGHDAAVWAERKRAVTEESSARWAGAITKTSNDQWALARRSLLAHIQDMQAAVATISHRLSLPVGAKSVKGSPGGYRSRQEWFAKSRRLQVLTGRLGAARADWRAGRLRIVRGGRRLLNMRHNLQAAQLTE